MALGDMHVACGFDKRRRRHDTTMAHLIKAASLCTYIGIGSWKWSSPLINVTRFCIYNWSQNVGRRRSLRIRMQMRETAGHGRSKNSGGRPKFGPGDPTCTSSSAMGELYAVICRGPLLQKVGFTPQMVAHTIDKWLELGIRLARLFGFNEFLLTESQEVRLYHFYVPVFLWCERELLQHRAKFKDTEEIPPLTIGISAPQGSGKTTLVYALDYLFNSAGRQAASISIDDFYLTAADQAMLAAENAGNALLELRGNAGSHDLAFGMDTLKALCSLTRKGTKAKVPRYDKSAHNGRGDRADPSAWPEIEGPLEVILFEGWMLGFKLQSSTFVKAVDPQLEAVNRNLESYYDAWEKFIGSWIIIKVGDPHWVYNWRLQAEIAMRNEGKPGMSDEQVFDFVSRYMPAYKAFLPALYSDGPRGAQPEHTLVVEVDESRSPLG